MSEWVKGDAKDFLGLSEREDREAKLLASPEFLAFCNAWEHDQRCPIGLIDWLRELGMVAESVAAQWCYETRTKDGRYRIPHTWPAGFSVYKAMNKSDLIHQSHSFPLSKPQTYSMIFDSFPKAIAFIITNFDHQRVGLTVE